MGTQKKPVEWKRMKLNFIFPISISFLWLLLFPTDPASWLTLPTQALSILTSISFYTPLYLLPRIPFPPLHLDKFQDHWSPCASMTVPASRMAKLRARHLGSRTFPRLPVTCLSKTDFSLSCRLGNTLKCHSSNKCYTSLYSPNLHPASSPNPSQGVHP